MKDEFFGFQLGPLCTEVDSESTFQFCLSVDRSQPKRLKPPNA